MLLKKAIAVILVIITTSSIHTLTHAQTPSPTCAPLPSNTGSVTTSVTIDTPAIYTIWSRLITSDSTSTSYYLQIDNSCPIKVGNVAMPINTWTWVNFQDGNIANLTTMSLTTGTHIVKLIGDKPLLGVDKVLFLRQACTPTGLGDNCTAIPTATSVPVTPTNTPIPPTPSPTTAPTPTFTATPTATISPSTVPPAITITSPLNNSIIPRKSSVTITTSSPNLSAITKVEFYVNNNLTCTDTTSNFSCAFNTSPQKNNPYTLTAKAFDKYNQSTTSTVTVIAQ